MTCTEVASVLQCHLDGETDAGTTRRLAEHLADCHPCGLELTVYEGIERVLSRRPVPDTAAVARLRTFGEALLRGMSGQEDGGISDGGSSPPAVGA